MNYFGKRKGHPRGKKVGTERESVTHKRGTLGSKRTMLSKYPLCFCFGRNNAIKISMLQR